MITIPLNASLPRAFGSSMAGKSGDDIQASRTVEKAVPGMRFQWPLVLLVVVPALAWLPLDPSMYRVTRFSSGLMAVGGDPVAVLAAPTASRLPERFERLLPELTFPPRKHFGFITFNSILMVVGGQVRAIVYL